MNDSGREYIGLEQIDGPLIFVEGISNVGFDEVVEIKMKNGEIRLGTVLEISETYAIIQVLEGTSGLSNAGTSVRFLGETLKTPVSKNMLGRVFDGLELRIR